MCICGIFFISTLFLVRIGHFSSQNWSCQKEEYNPIVGICHRASKLTQIDFVVLQCITLMSYDSGRLESSAFMAFALHMNSIF